MTGLEFAAALVDHLAWPAVAVAALLLLRKPLAARLKNLRSVRAGSFGAEFSTAERQVEQALQAEASRTSPVAGYVPEPGYTDRLDSLTDTFREIAEHASENPSYAIVASWTQLERQLHSAAAELEPGEAHARANSGRATRILLQQGVISEETYDAIASLKELRNEVAHGEAAPEAGSAVGYVRSVNEVAQLVYTSLWRRLRQESAS